MKKDIHPPKVEDVAVAIVRESDEIVEDIWNVYLVNMKKVKLEGVLVSSRGYGEVSGENVKTSLLRHFLDEMEPESYKKIEPIPEDLFKISNEYWVSFYVDGKMYDKKYIFLREAIKEDYFIKIPLINKKGVMIL